MAESDAVKVNAQELIAEIQNEWKIAQEAGASAVQRAVHLLSPESRREIEKINSEKAALEKRLAEAKHRIAEMEAIVTRFASVQDPVVASDGFTYDREQITKYVEECRAHGAAPVSQQNHQPLTERFVPNNSLKRLIETLRPLLDTPKSTTAPAVPMAVAPIG